MSIKDFDSDIYTLDYPNREIEVGLMKSLLPHYAEAPATESSVVAIKMRNAIRRGDMDGALRLLKKFLEEIPYTDNASSEGHYQQVLIIIFRMLGFQSDVELHTKIGRIDMVMMTPDRLYIIELKIRDDAETALEQIDLKQYDERFALCGLPTIKVGISFDCETRTLRDWKIQ